MLFDLRGRGRRRTVQAVYLGLAILMGGGLVLFGVGGNVSGGLLDAIKNNPSSSNSDLFTKRLQAAEKLAQTEPKNAQARADPVHEGKLHRIHLVIAHARSPRRTAPLSCRGSSTA